MSQSDLTPNFIKELFEVTQNYYGGTDFGKAFQNLYNVLVGVDAPYVMKLTVPGERGYEQRETPSPYPLQLKSAVLDFEKTINNIKSKTVNPTTPTAREIEEEQKRILDKYIGAIDMLKTLADFLLNLFEYHVRTERAKHQQHLNQTVLKHFEEYLQEIEKLRREQL